jgi:Uma2 family endonuclease
MSLGMVRATRKFTLDEYLAFDDGEETRYEFVDGERVEMPPETKRNNLIALYLLSEFLEFVPIQLICYKDTEILVVGNPTKVRIPDLLILTEELVTALGSKSATITQEMPAPTLAVEVVSLGKVHEDRDYRYKRSEYAARGIPEYWIVDPEKSRFTVLTLVDGFYEEAVFQGNDPIVSITFPVLNLSADQALRAGA